MDGERLVVLALAAAIAAETAVAGVVAVARRPRLRTYTIASSSMAPTLRPGDRLLCTRRIPDRLPRGAVVIFRGWGTGPPAWQTTDFVYRVVGLPNESVEVGEGGSVLVNLAPLAEPYAERGGPTAPRLTLGPGEYFVLGDNRDAAADSRFHGTVAHEQLRAVCTRVLGRGRIRGT